MHSIWQDVRVAVRGCMSGSRSSRSSSSSCSGSGSASTARCSASSNAVLLRPLDYPRASELVSRVQVSDRQRSAPVDLAAQLLRSARRAPGRSPASPRIGRPSVTISGAGGETGEGARRDVLERAVSACSASTRQPGAASSRTTTCRARGARGDARPRVVEAALRRRCGGVGRELMLDGAPALIVGVMPPGFEFPAAGTELWMPLRLSRTQPPNPAIRPEAYRQYRILNVVARVRAAAAVEQSQAELAGLGRRLAREYPDANRGTGFAVVPCRTPSSGRSGRRCSCCSARSAACC